jgi:hypothetical protein
MWECIVVESYMENALYGRAAIMYIYIVKSTYEYVWRRLLDARHIYAPNCECK